MYALYLKDRGLVPKDYFQALAGDFSIRNYPSKLFSDPMVMLARSTTMRWQGRVLSIAAEKRQKGAVTFDMLQEMHDFLWIKGSSPGALTADIDNLMCFVSGLAMYNWALRVSETSKVMPDSAYIEAGPNFELDQHASKAEDIMLGFDKPPFDDSIDDDVSLEWLSGYAFSEKSLTERDTLGIPQAAGLAQRTSKTNSRGLREVRYLVTRGSDGEDWLIDGLLFIANRAQYHTPTDMFFSRRSVKGSRGCNPRKRLTSEMMSSVIKACASRMGLPPASFSTKSYKTGGITSLRALGDSQAVVQSKTDHKTANASAHYQRSLLGRHSGGPSELRPDQGPLAGGELAYSTATYKIDLAFTAGLSSSSAASSVPTGTTKKPRLCSL
jgi:hypothetical protein